MNNLLKPEPRQLAHAESENFIKNLKQRITRKARYRQFLNRNTYTQCLDEICVELGLENRNTYSKILKSLSNQSERISKDKERMRCVLREELIPNTNYFVVRGKLALVINQDNALDSYIEVHGTYMEEQLWSCSEKAPDDSGICAKSVENPSEFLAKLRLVGEKEVHIINHESDLQNWLSGWSGIAFIQEKSARKNNKLSIWLNLKNPNGVGYVS
jgi:hypothetical protein